jgi:hypothetical protein
MVRNCNVVELLSKWLVLKGNRELRQMFPSFWDIMPCSPWTDVSEQHISIFRSKFSQARNQRGAVSQKIATFITTATRTSDSAGNCTNFLFSVVVLLLLFSVKCIYDPPPRCRIVVQRREPNEIMVNKPVLQNVTTNRRIHSNLY